MCEDKGFAKLTQINIQSIILPCQVILVLFCVVLWLVFNFFIAHLAGNVVNALYSAQHLILMTSPEYALRTQSLSRMQSMQRDVCHDRVSLRHDDVFPSMCSVALLDSWLEIILMFQWMQLFGKDVFFSLYLLQLALFWIAFNCC